MKDKIQKNNIILTIGELKKEQTSAARDLSDAYEKLKDEKVKIVKILKDAEKIKEKTKEWEGKRIDEQKNIDMIKKQYRQNLLKHENDIKKILYEKKIRIEKLEGLNFRIMNAEKQLQEIETKQKEGEKELIKIDELKVVKLQLEKNIQLLRNDHNILGKKHSILKGNYIKKTKELKKWINETEIKTNRLKEEANQAEYRMKVFNDEYVRKDEDLKIYIKRAQSAYNKVFPDLKMNI